MVPYFTSDVFLFNVILSSKNQTLTWYFIEKYNSKHFDDAGIISEKSS